jgi:DHA2 family multidrug resistance protein
VRGFAVMLCIVPSVGMALSEFQGPELRQASGLFNLMRNLGGAIGIAALQTLLTKREQYHSNVLTQQVTMFEQATRTRLDQLTQYFMSHGVIDRVDAIHHAYVAIGKIIQKQAFILGFSDTFYLLGVSQIVALLAALMLTKPGHLEAGGGH